MSYQFQIKIFHVSQKKKKKKKKKNKIFPSIRKDTLNVSSSNSLQIFHLKKRNSEVLQININLNWFKISIKRRHIYDDIEKFKSNKISAFWCIVCHQNQLYTWTLCYTFTLKFGFVLLSIGCLFIYSDTLIHSWRIWLLSWIRQWNFIRSWNLFLRWEIRSICQNIKKKKKKNFDY